MKPQDLAAIWIGTLAPLASMEIQQKAIDSLETVVTSAVSAVAVIVIKSLFQWIKGRLEKK